MTDREIMHKLLDDILDSNKLSAGYVEVFEVNENGIPKIRRVHKLEIREASSVTIITEIE